MQKELERELNSLWARNGATCSSKAASDWDAEPVAGSGVPGHYQQTVLCGDRVADMKDSKWKPELRSQWPWSNNPNYYQRNTFLNWRKVFSVWGPSLRSDLTCSCLWVWKTWFDQLEVRLSELTIPDLGRLWGWIISCVLGVFKAVLAHSTAGVVLPDSHICPPGCLDREVILLSKLGPWGLNMTYIYAWSTDEDRDVGFGCPVCCQLRNTR